MRTLTALAAVLVLTVAACGDPSTPPAASPTLGVTEFGDQDTGVQDCEDFEVRWFNQQEVASIVLSDPEGEVVWTREADDEFARVFPLWCGDLTADGAPELGYEHFSGGAHCCTYVEVISLVEPGTVLLGADFGNAGPPEPRQLDDGPLELVGSSDVFAYFELSFAASPFIPIVYGFDGERFVVVTEDFPEVVREDITAQLEGAAELRDDDGAEEALRGLALGVYGSYLILGDAEGGIERVRDEIPEAAAWLESLADDARAHFEATYAP